MLNQSTTNDDSLREEATIAAHHLSKATGLSWQAYCSLQNKRYAVVLSSPIDILAYTIEEANQKFTNFLHDRLNNKNLMNKNHGQVLTMSGGPGAYAPPDFLVKVDCTIDLKPDIEFLAQLDLSDPLLRIKMAASHAFKVCYHKNVLHGPKEYDNSKDILDNPKFFRPLHNDAGKAKAKTMIDLLNKQQNVPAALALLKKYFNNDQGAWRPGSFKSELFDALIKKFYLINKNDKNSLNEILTTIANLSSKGQRDASPQL